MEHKGDGATSCSGCTWNDSQRLRMKAEGIGNQRKNRDHPN